MTAVLAPPVHHQTTAAAATIPLDDAELLRLVADGDDTAMRAMMRRYGWAVAGTVRRVTTDRQQVDEAIQRTWIALWRRADTIRDASRAGGWLLTTARREAIAVARAGRREVLVAEPEPEPADDQDPADLVVQLDSARSLRAAVDLLPQRQRQLILEILADRGSYAELADTLRIARGSVGPTRLRAIDALRRVLAAGSVAGHPASRPGHGRDTPGARHVGAGTGVRIG